MKGWEIPLMEIPQQKKIPQDVKMNSLEEMAMDKEIESMLSKGAIREAIPKEDQFLSNVFVTPKGEGQFRPIINLKKLNEFVPYHHFKMEGLKDVKHILREGDWMCKIDLSDAYFSVPLGTRSRKLVRFKWKGKLYEFLCLAFGLGPAPRIFTKLMKVPVAILRRLGIRLVIYLDDILIMGSTQEEVIRARDTMMYLFYHLGLTINMKKSVLSPSQELEFLGVMVNSLTMVFSLSKKKKQKLISVCQGAYRLRQITLRSLCSLIGKLWSTAAAVTPAPLQLRYLQQSCIKAQAQKLHYEKIISLSSDAILELKWWIQNLSLMEGNPIQLPPPELIICSDAAKTGGWGAVCHLGSTGGTWSEEERELHINVQELLAAELAIRTFTRNHIPRSIHMMIDNTTALSYLIKMGGTKNIHMVEITKRIWEFLLQHRITITAEWIPSHLNKGADWESRNVSDSSEWKLRTDIFQAILLEGTSINRPICIKDIPSTSEILQLESRSILPSSGRLSTNMESGVPLCISSILSDHKGPKTNTVTKSSKNDTRNSSVANSTLVPNGHGHGSSNTNLTPSIPSPIVGPIGRNASITSRLLSKPSGLASVRDRLRDSGVSEEASSLIVNSRRGGTTQTYESAWKKWGMWCRGRGLDPFTCPINHILDFLSGLFSSGTPYRTIGGHRSAISAYHTPFVIDAAVVPAGRHPLVSALMSGVHNLRPPQAKYSFTWDIEVVLCLFKSWPLDLTPKQLTQKVTTLLALIGVPRGAELHLFDLNYMADYGDKTDF